MERTTQKVGRTRVSWATLVYTNHTINRYEDTFVLKENLQPISRTKLLCKFPYLLSLLK